MGEPLLIERDGDVLVATFNRPRQANALTVAMQTALTAQVSEAAGDATCSGVVVGGGTGPVFSAGGDFRETHETMPEEAFTEVKSGALFDLMAAILACPLPVVVAVNGHAVGGGCLLALVSDARVADPGATFSLPEIDLGRPTFAGVDIVRRRISETVAADLVQTGRRMDIEEAATHGLVDKRAATADLVQTAVGHVHVLARHPAAFAANKAWLNRGFAEDLERARHRSADFRRREREAQDTGSRPVGTESGGVR